MDSIINEFDSEFLLNGLKEIEPIIFYKDLEARYIFCNHFKQHTNYDNGHNWDVYGKTDMECRDDKENARRAYENDLEIIKTGKKEKYVIKKMVDGIIRYLEIEKGPVYKDGKIVGLVGLIVDITEKMELKKELEKLANNDQLTGLYNRNYLHYWLENLNTKSLYPLSLIMTDLNDLKEVNDTYGHASGDEYIKDMALLLNDVLPEDSITFRIGGDEYLAILPNTKIVLAKEYVDKLKHGSCDYKINDITLSASYGVSEVSEYTEDFDKYINEADHNMYIEKEKYHTLKKKINH